uniref:Uncharacterized protein n=1 Tax=Avena sativa TaxID=4498 RepID=A0ACD5TLH6_AVESA
MASNSKQVLYMNPGQGETSYARNSSIQKFEQNRMKPFIEAAVVDICTHISTGKVLIADLGCSSGPNALALVSIAIEAIHDYCLQFQQTPPEVCVLLNDLPNNDFNSVVKRLDTLRQSSNHHVVMTGITPGSFYQRLFTSGSMHLVCSSNSLHWLSQAPEVLTRNQISAYDIDEHARRERLPMILEAYAHQFKKDFTLFLELRAKELVPGGRLVISLPGRRSDEVSSKSIHLWETLAQILRVMALEGVIDKAKYDSFYVPMYGPSDQDLREFIQYEGSFLINEMHWHDLLSGFDNALITTSWFANHMRAAYEPIVVQHFEEVMDDFVMTAERHWSKKGSMIDELSRSSIKLIIISLTRK